MSDVFLTGATGMLGNNIARQLVASGRHVRALVRSATRARGIVPAGCELVEGDVTDPASVHRAMRDCAVVYHASGLPEQWLPDPATFRRVNVDGTHHMIEAALEHRVTRFVYASTIDVFVIPRGEPFDESALDPEPKGTHYERSKQDADRLVTQALDRGLPAVFLHPSGIYGPGPATSPGTNQLIGDLARGKVPMLLPGGIPVVYSEDVAAGHLLAESKAPVGARYILSESDVGLVEMAELVRSITGTSRVPAVMPLAIARVVAVAGEALSRLTRRPPLLPEGQLHFLQYRAHPVAERARRELGWSPVALDDGVRRTLAFLRESGRA